MAEITFKGKSFEVDEDGFLLHFDDWCPEWLEYVEKKTNWCYLEGKKKRVFFDYNVEKFLHDMEGEKGWTANSIKVPFKKEGISYVNTLSKDLLSYIIRTLAYI